MNDIDQMPNICHECPYWEIAVPPYICLECESKMKQNESNLEDIIKAVETISKFCTRKETKCKNCPFRLEIFGCAFTVSYPSGWGDIVSKFNVTVGEENE